MHNKNVGWMGNQWLPGDICPLLAEIALVIIYCFSLDQSAQRLHKILAVLYFDWKAVEKLFCFLYCIAFWTRQHVAHFSSVDVIHNSAIRCFLHGFFQPIENHWNKLLSILLGSYVDSLTSDAFEGKTEIVGCKIHPLALFKVCEHFP